MSPLSHTGVPGYVWGDTKQMLELHVCVTLVWFEWHVCVSLVWFGPLRPGLLKDVRVGYQQSELLARGQFWTHTREHRHQTRRLERVL